MDDLGDTGGRTGTQQVDRAVDVDRPEQLAILGERHLGDVVQHDVDAVDGVAHDRLVADVTLDELDIGRPVVGIVQVEHSDVMAGSMQSCDDERTEIAAPAGDEIAGHSSIPSQFDALVETPSNAVAHALGERELRVVAELVACCADVDGDVLVHLAEHVELRDVPAGALGDRVDLLGDGSGEVRQPEARSASPSNPSAAARRRPSRRSR